MKFPFFILILITCTKLIGQSSAFSVSVSTTKHSCKAGTASISVSGGTEPFFYNWNNGLQGDTQTNLEAGSYNVSIVDGNGKDTLITITIEEEICKVIIQNSFSPNSDNINDVWGISNWKNYPEFQLYVYNRWGQLVHSQKGEYTPWDGKQLGIDLPVATYYYVFYYSGNTGDMEKGDVTIMR